MLEEKSKINLFSFYKEGEIKGKTTSTKNGLLCWYLFILWQFRRGENEKYYYKHLSMSCIKKCYRL